MKLALPYVPKHNGSYSTLCSIYSMHSYCTPGKLLLIHNDYASLVSYITSKQMFEIYCETTCTYYMILHGCMCVVVKVLSMC